MLACKKFAHGCDHSTRDGGEDGGEKGGEDGRFEEDVEVDGVEVGTRRAVFLRRGSCCDLSGLLLWIVSTKLVGQMP